MRYRRLILLAAGCLAVATARSQPAVLSVHTNDPLAHVLADSTWLGRAAAGPFVIEPGRRLIRVVPSAAGTWGVASQVIAVDPGPGDSVTVRAPFPYLYRIESSPRADVVLERTGQAEALGSTPVLFRTPQPVEGVFRIGREGYRPAFVEPGSDLWNTHVVRLDPLEDPAAGAFGISEEPAPRNRRWIDYAAVGVAAAAGIVAVHYKRKADRRYDRYLQTGDPGLRPVIDRYDRYSAIALGTMQVGVGVFAIRLALR